MRHAGGTRRRRRTTNPHREGVKSFAIEGAKAIVAGGVSAIATRAVVQGVLGDKNTGAMGYLANFAVALGGAYGLFHLTKSRSIAMGWAAGGAASTIQRIWSEKVSQTSPAPMSGLGDLDYSSNGLGGVGLSGFVNSGYALPSITAADGTVQPAFQPQLPAVSAAAASSSGAAVTNIPQANVARFQPRY